MLQKLLQQMIIHTESINQSFLCPNKQQWLIIVSWPCPVPPRPALPPSSKLFHYGTTQVPNQARLPVVWQVRTASSGSSYYCKSGSS